MTTPTIIVDGKDSTGKRLSISLDAALWSLFVAAHDHSPAQARKVLKYQMSEGLIGNTYQAKCWVYQVIARPDLLQDQTTTC